MSWGDTADQKVKQYKMDLECATDVGCRGVSSEQAWDLSNSVTIEQCETSDALNFHM